MSPDPKNCLEMSDLKPEVHIFMKYHKIPQNCLKLWDFDDFRSWEQKILLKQKPRKLFDGAVYRKFDFLMSKIEFNWPAFDHKNHQISRKTKYACSRPFYQLYQNPVASSAFLSRGAPLWRTLVLWVSKESGWNERMFFGLQSVISPKSDSFMRPKVVSRTRFWEHPIPSRFIDSCMVSALSRNVSEL